MRCSHGGMRPGCLNCACTMTPSWALWPAIVTVRGGTTSTDWWPYHPHRSLYDFLRGRKREGGGGVNHASSPRPTSSGWLPPHALASPTSTPTCEGTRGRPSWPTGTSRAPMFWDLTCCIANLGMVIVSGEEEGVWKWSPLLHHCRHWSWGPGGTCPPGCHASLQDVCQLPGTLLRALRCVLDGTGVVGDVQEDCDW